jgi:catechol 2,3-dioxygenase-like lactoylglutathione lyase family enzyme
MVLFSAELEEREEMKAIIHTGVTVSNLDRSIEWYRDVLGLELTVGPSEMVGDDAFSEAVGVPGAVSRYCMMKAGEEYVELFEYAEPQSPVEKPLPMNALGPTHVCFLVDDIDFKVAELQSKGVKFFSPVRVETEGPEKGTKWVFFHDPDGVALELFQLAPNA